MKTSDITKLATEQRNPRSRDIDRLTTKEMVELINSEDKKVACAVEKVCPQIAAAIDLIYARMKRGGRLIYCGCGTSGRLGVLFLGEKPGVPGIIGAALILSGIVLQNVRIKLPEKAHN